jgi:predicted AAA+ superfamily ATPase
MNNLFSRSLKISLPKGQSAFLWGPRKVGKSTFLKQRFPKSPRFDFLESDLYLEMLKSPSLLRSRIIAGLDAGAIKLKLPIILDEVQKVPAVLDEVHWLIEERGCSFILCGSSARKLKHGHANMLGGRAWRFEMHPLTVNEVPGFNLLRALNNGLVPSHYLQENARKSLRAYVQDYLKEEIIAEGLTRTIPAFSRFTDILGFCNGEMINFTNIARDTGVDAKTVREYFQILSDTMIGRLIEPFCRKGDRNIINKTPKFYLFDVGLAQYLSKTRIEEERGQAFGRAFEHFIFMELCAHCAYSEADYAISYWRTANGYEVDFVLGPGRIAVEVKSNAGSSGADFKGLLRFKDDYSPSRAIVVSNERARRKIGPIEIIPWQEFLDELWAGKVIS